MTATTSSLHVQAGDTNSLSHDPIEADQDLEHGIGNSDSMIQILSLGHKLPFWW